MTFYEKKLREIKKEIYSNQSQIDTVIGIKNYIDNNFANEINLTMLSKIGLISKFHLLRLFKQYYGETPRQYLIAKRLEKSKEYLQKGLSVSETCFLVGLESPSSFSILFKSKNGISPIEYQKAIFNK